MNKEISIHSKFLNIKDSKHSIITRVISTDKFHVFILFSSFEYHFLNLKSNKTITGKISPTDFSHFPVNPDICALSTFKIVFLSFPSNSIFILDIEKSKVEKNGIRFPSVNAFVNFDDKVKLNNYLDENYFKIVGLPQNNMFVVLEKKASNDENLISVYNEKFFPNFCKQANFSSQEKYCNIKNINNSDCIVVYPQKANAVTINFFYWKVKDPKGFSIISTTSIVNGHIADVSDFGQNKIGFWINNSEMGIPLIEIFDIEKKITTKINLKLPINDWLIESVLFSFGLNFALIKVINENCHYSLIDLKNLKIIEKIEENFDVTTTSFDNKYLVGINEDFSIKTSNKIFFYYFIYDLEIKIRFLMNKACIREKYGNFVYENVLSILID